MTKQSIEIKELIPVKHKGKLVFRIYNFNPTGYIIITADDNAEPVIGYGLDSNFSFDNAPPALLFLLEGYKNEMAAIIENQLEANAKISEKWDKYSSSVSSSLKSYTPYTSLLETTWGQENGYNYECPDAPYYPYDLCVAGCSAIALAQILHYWGCRVFPDGSNTYTPPGFTNSLTVNFYNQDYDWDAMNHNSADADNTELIYHCGVAIEVSYTDSTTSGWTNDAKDAMENYFGFDTDGVQWKNDSSSSTWENMLKTDIDAERPIYYRGQDSASTSAHAWVVDGYYGNEFHCNWGWYGDDDEWYTLSTLNPSASSDFNYTQGAILGAEPILDACSGLEGSTAVCSSSNESYSVSIPSTASVEWSRSGAVNQVGSNNTSPTYTVSYASNGEGTITATIKNSQGQTFLTRTKDVWVGTPHDLFGVYCEGGDGGPVGTYPVWTGPFYEEYDSIVWEVYPSATITEVGYGIADIYFSSPGGYQITAYCANKCDDGEPEYTYFYVYSMLMSPNPAYDEVEITIDCGETEDLKSASLAKQEYVVTISDMYGITKSQKNYSGNKFTIPVQHLKEGNYIVRLSNDKILLSKQLIIKR